VRYNISLGGKGLKKCHEGSLKCRSVLVVEAPGPIVRYSNRSA
jgi:hypothetical protein